MMKHPYFHAVAYACGMWLSMTALVAACTYLSITFGGLS